MVDGVLVLVDAYEGVMPQTKFVVKKMLALGIKPIVVINKIDKPSAEPDRVVDEMFDLFDHMGATDDQQDFPIIYTAARDGIAKMDMSDPDGDFTCIFDAIINDVPEPKGDAANSLQAQVFTLDYDNYVGKIGISRIFNGTVKKGDNIILAKANGEMVKGKISKLIGFLGLNRMEIDQAEAGDIVAFAGMETVDVGDTVADPQNPVALDPMHVEEPTLTVVFAVNDSPLAGKEGKHVTSNKLRERLEFEMNTNVAMKLEIVGEGKFKVSGRGELQITVLAENMRREDFEFSISRPEVIVKEVEGVKCEPFEHLVIDVPEDLSGGVIERLGKRKAEMKSMLPMGQGFQRIEFEIPARALIGFRGQFLTDTKGEGVMNHSFIEFRPYSGGVESRSYGALVSMTAGSTLAFSLFGIQNRGTLYIGVQTEVYEGMIVGEHSRDNDLVVNPIKGKAQSNVRSSGADEAIKLIPPRDMSLERALEWIEDDEILEITPKSIRIRKKFLTESERKRHSRK